MVKLACLLLLATLGPASASGHARVQLQRQGLLPPPVINGGGVSCFGVGEGGADVCAGAFTIGLLLLSAAMVPALLKKDGGWSDFTSSGCSATCGRGTQTSTRVCDNPSPAWCGAPCKGPATVTGVCHLAKCPVFCYNDSVCTAAPAKQFVLCLSYTSCDYNCALDAQCTYFSFNPGTLDCNLYYGDCVPSPSLVFLSGQRGCPYI